MTPQEAYDVAEEVTREHLTFEGQVAPEDDARDFVIGEAAAYLADLDMMPDVRRAALRGLIAGATNAGILLFDNEKQLADAVAEELNTAL
jgi:hypothetical protein